MNCRPRRSVHFSKNRRRYYIVYGAVEHDWRHQGCRKDVEAGKRSREGWKKGKSSDGSYGNWRFITPRQATQSYHVVLATRGDTMRLRPRTPYTTLPTKTFDEDKTAKKRTSCFSSMFTSGHGSSFFLQHRNYFVITRSLCSQTAETDGRIMREKTITRNDLVE